MEGAHAVMVLGRLIMTYRNTELPLETGLVLVL
jgi:hypothetical protein